jgi:hypothetical protein
MMFSLFAQTGARKFAYRNLVVSRGFQGTFFLQGQQQNSKNNRTHNEGKKRRKRKNRGRKSKESWCATKNFAPEIEEKDIHLRLASQWTKTSELPTLHPAVQSVWSKLEQKI